MHSWITQRVIVISYFSWQKLQQPLQGTYERTIQTYIDQFLQPSFRKYCIKLGTNISLGQQSEHNNIWDQSTWTTDQVIIKWSINAKNNLLFCFIICWVIAWYSANIQLICQATTAKTCKTIILASNDTNILYTCKSWFEAITMTFCQLPCLLCLYHELLTVDSSNILNNCINTLPFLLPV